MIDLSCKDWAKKIEGGLSLVPIIPDLNTRAADRAIKTFNALRLPDVPGQPKLETASGDWFRDIIYALFGSVSEKTGDRSVGEVFCLVPKKSSKTTYSAALMLTALLVNSRPRAEFLFIAPSLMIADLAFKQSAGMIDLDPFLQKIFHVQPHLRLITHRRTNATLQVKSFDPAIVTGTRAAGILVDELHVVASASEADRVIGQLRGGLISQNEGFLFFISTQSERAPSGVFRAEIQKARAIRDGHMPGRMLPVLYEFPEGIDWRDPGNWHIVMPNIGRPVTVDRLIGEYHVAKAAGEQELRRWATQHLNVEIGIGTADLWVGGQYWEDCGNALLTLDELLARSEVCTVGIDGGGLDDLLGLCVMGRDRTTKQWLSWCHSWVHSKVLQARKDVSGRLKDFATEDSLTLIERIGDDVLDVARVVEQVSHAGLFPVRGAIGIDPAGIGEIIEAISGTGIDVRPEAGVIVGIQGWKLTGSIKTVERKLASGELQHDGSLMMAWCVGNAKVEPKGNGIAITKQTAGKSKIDPLMALFNAAALMALKPLGKGRSVYEEIATRAAKITPEQAKQKIRDENDERFW